MKLRLLVLSLALGTTACSGLPTLESIKYGYRSDGVEATVAQPTLDEHNDIAAGWAPDLAPASTSAAQQPAVQPVLYGRDGSPVGAAEPGSITTTPGPINDGVSKETAQGGSRSLLLDLYGDTVEERDELLRANEDLQAALDLAEQRTAELSGELESLKAKFDALGVEKQALDTQLFDLAARLATAQVARLESERALLEATIEWRRMSQANNSPLIDDTDS